MSAATDGLIALDIAKEVNAFSTTDLHDNDTSLNDEPAIVVQESKTCRHREPNRENDWLCFMDNDEYPWKSLKLLQLNWA